MFADIGHNTMVLWIWLGAFGCVAISELAYAWSKRDYKHDEDEEDTNGY
jgi:hypothetical protein